MQIFLNGVFTVPGANFPPDVHEDDLGEVTHGVAQHREGAQPVEELDAPEVALAEITFRVQPAAPRHLIEDGILEDGAEGFPPRLLRQRRQQRAVHLLFDAVHRVLQVFLRYLFSHIFQRQHDGADIGQVVGSRQVSEEPIPVAVIQPPDVGIGRAAHGMGVRDVKDIAQPLWLGGVVDEGDALRAAIHPPSDLLIPRIQRGAGRGFRPLGVNQQLLQEAVAVHPRSDVHEAHPVLRGTADRPGLGIGQVADIVQFRQSDHFLVAPARGVLNRRSPRRCRRTPCPRRHRRSPRAWACTP